MRYFGYYMYQITWIFMTKLICEVATRNYHIITRIKIKFQLMLNILGGF